MRMLWVMMGMVQQQPVSVAYNIASTISPTAHRAAATTRTAVLAQSASTNPVRAEHADPTAEGQCGTAAGRWRSAWAGPARMRAVPAVGGWGRMMRCRALDLPSHPALDLQISHPPSRALDRLNHPLLPPLRTSPAVRLRVNLRYRLSLPVPHILLLDRVWDL